MNAYTETMQWFRDEAKSREKEDKSRHKTMILTMVSCAIISGFLGVGGGVIGSVLTSLLQTSPGIPRDGQQPPPASQPADEDAPASRFDLDNGSASRSYSTP